MVDKLLVGQGYGSVVKRCHELISHGPNTRSGFSITFITEDNDAHIQVRVVDTQAAKTGNVAVLPNDAVTSYVKHLPV